MAPGGLGEGIWGTPQRSEATRGRKIICFILVSAVMLGPMFYWEPSSWWHRKWSDANLEASSTGLITFRVFHGSPMITLPSIIVGGELWSCNRTSRWSLGSLREWERDSERKAWTQLDTDKGKHREDVGEKQDKWKGRVMPNIWDTV